MHAELKSDLLDALAHLKNAVAAELESIAANPAAPGSRTSRIDSHAVLINALATIVGELLADLA